MADFMSALYAGVLRSSTSNKPGQGVVRNADGSIDVGPANVTNVNNAGGMTSGGQAFTAAGTLSATTRLITVSGAAAAYNLTLPPASGCPGVEWLIVLINATHAVTLTNGADNIVSSGVATASTYALSTIGQHVILWSDGTQFYVK